MRTRADDQRIRPAATRRKLEASDRTAREEDELDRRRRQSADADILRPAASPSDGERRRQWIMRAQRNLGNQAVQRLLHGAAATRGGSLAVQRDPAAGIPSDAKLDVAMARFIAGVCGQYLTYEAPGAPLVQTSVQVWKSFSGGGEVDEDHFYDSGKPGDTPHVKVRAFRGVGPDLQAPTGDTFSGRIVTWNASGQENTVKRFNGWLEISGGDWVVHSGDKPAPSSPPPASPSRPPRQYDDDDNVPV